MTATDHAVELVVAAARAASDKLAEKIIAFDVSEELAITDAFVIASASNDRQVKAIVDEVEDKLREIGAKPIRREGERDGRWVLIDYGEIVVHVQHEEEREFYALERLWRDCPVIDAPGRPHGPAERMSEGTQGRTLVLLRHGRTAWNHARRVQGQIDVSLDDEGRAQAKRVAEAMADLAPSRLWVSDLLRARETAAPVAAATSLEPTYDARLREFSLGEREGLTHDEYRTIAPEEFEHFRRGDFDRALGAEQSDDVRARMWTVLTDLLAGLAPGETGLAVSHGAAIRVATGALLGWPDETFHTLRGLDNCGWVVLQEDPGVSALRLLAYNRTA